MPKQLPNILSVLRMVLAVALLPAAGVPVLFGAGYLLCGLTDVLDGFIARHWHLESRLGAKLDTLGDLLFWGVVLVLFFVQVPVSWPVAAAFALVAAVRGVNALITRGRFGEWGMLHTLGNKAAGLLLYLLLPVCILTGRVAAPVGVVLFAVALLSALEETAILLTAGTYDPDRKGIWQRK